MKDLIKKLECGQISNKDFADAMMTYHHVLMDYPELLKNQKFVNSIEITTKGVLLNIIDELVAPKTVRMMLSSRVDSRCFSAWILDFGSVEEKELKIFNKVVSILNPQSFFDVGANEGWYSFHMMTRFPEINCYSFEPIPNTYNRSKRNLEINGLNTNHLYNVGISDEKKTVTFYFDEAESGATSMQNIREKTEINKVECELIKLDDFVEQNSIKRMDLIKIDIEGSEIFAIRGALESIKKYRPVIFCEMLRKWCAKFGYHPNDIIEILKPLGYECYAISDSGLIRIENVTEETVETNFFFFDTEKHINLIRECV